MSEILYCGNLEIVILCSYPNKHIWDLDNGFELPELYSLYHFWFQ